jgi:hypothetical protein
MGGDDGLTVVDATDELSAAVVSPTRFGVPEAAHEVMAAASAPTGTARRKTLALVAAGATVRVIE